jgi:peptidoglycan/LPS O-acetylase OafA/YrhL
MYRTTRSRSRSRIAANTKRAFRPDIQGLRAVAVLVVFLDHMIGWPSGGFIGVDMFFVISGFLITGLLLREYTASGHISAKKFYLSRSKRIFPAAILTLVVTSILAFLVFTQQRAIAITWDSIWAFLFTSNWNFALKGTDYFQQDGAVSPVQHFWSLSVEEQFYFVWPWLLLGLLALFAKFGKMTERRTRLIAGISVGVIVVASFAWAMHQAVTEPTFAYFSTLTRAWELGAGALLAVTAPLFMRIPGPLRTVLAYLGLVVMIGSCFVITSETPWPAPWALLPVIGTALVIISGIGSPAPFFWPLTNPIAVYIGDISYSLYLWHFPAIIFGLALFPNAGLLTYFGIAIAGFGIAIAAYHTVEKPIWRSPLWTSPVSKRAAWKEWRMAYVPAMQRGALAGLGITTMTLVLLAVLPILNTQPSTALGPAPVFGTQAAEAEPDTAVTALTKEVQQAVGDSAWPATLTPSVDTIGQMARVDAWVEDGCLAREMKSDANFEDTTARCIYGNPEAPNTAVLVGDSVGVSWVPALVGALGDQWKIQVFTMQQCPYANISVKGVGGGAYSECDEFHEWTRSEIERIHPNMVVASQIDSVLSNLTEGGYPELNAATTTTLQEFAANSDRVVVLGAPLAGKPFEECYTSSGSPNDCLVRMNTLHPEMNAAIQADVTGLGIPTVSFVDTNQLFCSQDYCPAFANDIIIRADGAHLTQEYSTRIGAPLAEMLATP